MRFTFGGLLGGKILWETNIQNGWQKLDKKLLSSVFHDYIRTWHSHFMFGRSSASTRDWKTTKNLYNAVFPNIRGKENKEKPKNIIQKLKKETLLFQARKKWHMEVQFNARNVSSRILKKDLRLTRNQFLNLTNELQLYISSSLLSPNHRTLNADKKTCTNFILLERYRILNHDSK